MYRIEAGAPSFFVVLIGEAPIGERLVFSCGVLQHSVVDLKYNIDNKYHNRWRITAPVPA